jgi:antitoxin component of RelBE/YafQ-DinJ toxin-antitoxin module
MAAEAAGFPVLLEVDALIRRYGLVPSEDVRSLLARAAEQRMLERGEPFEVAVQRAMAALALSAAR